MKAEELRQKNKDELKTLLIGLCKEQMNLRFQHGGGQLENKARLRHVRHDIARIKTIMSINKSKAAS